MKALLIKGNRADVVTTAADAWKELLDTTVTGTASLMIGGKSYQVIYNNCFADYGKLRPTVLYNESTVINGYQRSSTVINGHQRLSTVINGYQRSSTVIYIYRMGNRSYMVRC